MEERDPKWKESGKAFIESVTTLLERLLDYRNALQVRNLILFSYNFMFLSETIILHLPMYLFGTVEGAGNRI